MSWIGPFLDFSQFLCLFRLLLGRLPLWGWLDWSFLSLIVVVVVVVPPVVFADA